MKKKQHIDDVQPATVDEHFQLLMDDTGVMDTALKQVSAEDLPEWFDEELFKRGQDYYVQHLPQMSIASFVGLIAILSVPETLDVLIFTKQSSSVCPAFRRYSQTLLHIYMMHTSDVKDSQSKFYKSLNVVRWKHATACARSIRAGIAGIYDRDMVITQFGFIGYTLLTPYALALPNKPEDHEAYNHFWRVTGHLLGIPDRINVCRKNATETTELCSRIANEVLGKYMTEAEPRYLELVGTTLKGTWYIEISLDPDALIALTYNLTGLEYKKPLSWYSWCNYQYRNFILYLLRLPIVGFIVQIVYNNLLKLLYSMLERYPIYAYMFLGKDNSKICLYPKLKFA